MTLNFQKGLLRGFVQSMYDEGIVNDQFCQVLALKDSARPDYVVRAVTMYCVATQSLFSQMTLHIDQPEVNFVQVGAFARQLHARSNGIGAEHVKLACAEILRACDENDKEYCSRALYWTKNEFSNLRSKFETVVQGIVNDQFSQIQALKSAEERDGVVQLINTYCVEVESILSELRSYIDFPVVDFSRLAAQARKIEEKSLCIGAEHVRLACTDLIQASDEKHKENFSWALTWMKNEFAHTRNKLETLAQMERRIIRLEGRQQK